VQLSSTIKTDHKAQTFTGEFAGPTVILALFVIFAYAALAFKALSAQMPVGLTGSLAACLYYMGYTVLHEAVHGSISGKNKSLRWANDALGYIMGQILCVSYGAHKRQHLKNHGHRDKPAHCQKAGLIQDALSVARLQYQNFFTANRIVARRSECLIVLFELSLMIAWRLTAILFFASYEGIFFFIGSVVLGVLILVVLFIWCVHPAKLEENRYQNTLTIVFPKYIHKPLTRVWLFQNYHIIHHLFPRVPFYHYETLFYEIEDELIANKAPVIRL